MMDAPVTLVTGGSGLVGNNVCRLLLEQGGRVRILMRERSDRRPIEGLDVEIVIGDLRDADVVRRAVDGASQIIHAAGHVQIGWRCPEVYRATNVDGTRHVAGAARAAAARLIHVSTTDAIGSTPDGRPADEETPHTLPVPIPYVTTKLEAEAVVLEEVEKGLDATIVNPGFMLGPWDWKPSSGRMLLAVARGQGFAAPRGTISLCDVRDVARGIVAAIEHGERGKRYILAGETFTYFDAWRLMADVTGAVGPLFRTNGLIDLAAGGIGNLVGWITGSEPDVNSGSLAIARVPKNYSSARAQVQLGYQNRPVRESIEAAWNWFREHGYAR